MEMKLIKQLVQLLEDAGLPHRPCGLNADWACRAWHLGPGRVPNMTSGDLYLLDDESDTGDRFTLVRRWYEEESPTEYARWEGVEVIPQAEEVTIDVAVKVAVDLTQPGIVPLFKFLCSMSKTIYSVTLFREAEVTIDVEALDREEAIQEARDNVCGLSFPKDWDTESLYVTQIDGEECDE